MAPGAAEKFLAKLGAGSLAGAQRFAQTLGAYTYQVPNAPNPYGSTPGYRDAIGAGISILVNPAALTPAQVKAALPPLPALLTKNGTQEFLRGRRLGERAAEALRHARVPDEEALI